MAPLNGRQFGVYTTPERRRSIEQAMPPVFVGTSQYSANELGYGKRGTDARRAQARVGRDLMQSAVQPEHLKGLESITVGKRLSPGTDARYQAYMGHPEGYIEHSNPYNQPQSRELKNARQFHLIHEIGHHQDPETHEETKRLGVTEARADNFATWHTPQRNDFVSGYERYNENRTKDERDYNAVRHGWMT